MKKIMFITALCAAMWGCTQSSGHRPVNRNATQEARKLLDFLYSIQGEYTLTGQHNFISGLDRYDSVVYAMTGKNPVIWGSDFSFNALGDNQKDFHHCGPMNLNTPWGELQENDLTTEQHRQNLVDQAKLRHAEGRIITLMWHCCWPTSCDACNGDEIWTWADGLPSNAEWRELTTDGTPLNEAWKRQVDGVAAYLKQLQEAGIPVLWRPYHEMNGVWFWWCNKPGEEGFVKLWRMMYDRYTNHHGLNNLLWVWNTNAPRDIPGDEAFPYADFFPGAEYVDVLAADVYKGDYKQSHHDQLVELSGGKLITLGEVGALPTVEQYEPQPQWSWFMTWGYFVNNQTEQMNAIYHHPRSLTLDRVEFKDGKYNVKR